MARGLPLVLRPVGIHALITVAGAVLALTPLLAALKLSGLARLQWWAVLLPVAAVLLAVFVAFSIAGFTWIYTALRIFGGAPPDPQTEGGEISLDVFFRTAKICFLGHGYVTMLIIALALLLWKLHFSPDMPVVYPLLPLIALGSLYLFVAVMFKQPEVDVGLSFFVGSVLLSQCVMLVVKLDHFGASSERFPWAVAFIPSWLAYALILVFCAGRATICVKQLFERRATLPSGVMLSPGATSIDAGAVSRAAAAPPGSDRESRTTSTASASADRENRLYRKLRVLAAVAVWVVGFCVSQILLTLRLDSAWKAHWLAVIAPGLFGWMMLVVFAAFPVSLSVAQAARLVFDPFGSSGPDPEYGEAADDMYKDERQPLLPWR